MIKKLKDMDREEVYLELEPFTELVFEDKTKDFIKLEEEIDYVELGMGLKNMIMIAKRKSDGKFFRFEYASDEGRNSLDVGGLANTFPMYGFEVFPKQITKTIYT
jgi:hypothetical protein